MIERSPAACALLNSPGARNLYDGLGWQAPTPMLFTNRFHAAVDYIAATEVAGGNPWDAAREVLCALSEDLNELTNRLLEHLNTTPSVQILLEPPKQDLLPPKQNLGKPIK